MTSRPAQLQSRVAILTLLLILGATGITGAQAPADVPPVPWQIDAETFLGRRTGQEVGEFVDVTITHEDLTAVADRGTWNQSTEIATLVGAVKLTEGESVVTCDSLVYLRTRQLAFLFGQVRALDGIFSAEGDSARVDRVTERVSLFGNARVVDDQGTITARRVDYDRATGVAVARGQVSATDGESGTVVTGERLVYNRDTGLATMTGTPKLKSTSTGVNALDVLAEEFVLRRGERHAEARENVRIEQGMVRATADFAEIFEDEGWIRLTGSPVTRDPGGEIHADTMLVWFTAQNVDSLVASGNVYITHEPSDKPGERTDAYGNAATAWFEAGRIARMLVHGNAVSDHFPSATDLAQGSGVNHSRADSMLMKFEQGNIETVTLTGESSGRYWFEPEAARGKRRRGERPTNPKFAASSPGATVSADSTEAGVEPDSLVTAEVDSAASRVLSVSDLLTVEADSDSSVVDSLPTELQTWRDRTGSLDDVAPPDTLFPYEMDTVTYAADEVQFSITANDLNLDGTAALQYGETWLRAGNVIFDVENETVEAVRDPVLTDPGGEIRGLRMDYDVEEKAGIVHHGRTEFDGGYYYGVRIKKLSDDVLIGESCTYTTCDKLSPHFHFLAPKMKIRLKDKAVARPVVLHVADIPVVALPYFMFPIRRGGRRSGWLQPQLEVGTSSRRGRYIRNLGYYWATNDYLDVTAWGEFSERTPRWVGSVRTRYNQRYGMNGELFLSGSINLPERVVPELDGGSRRWEVRGRHSHQINRTTSLIASANFISSRDFRLEQDIGTSYETQVDRRVDSRGELRKRWDWGSAGISVSRSQDLEAGPGDSEVNSILPSLSFSLSSRPIGRAAEGREAAFLPWLASVNYGYTMSAQRTLQTVLADSTEGDREESDFTLNQTLSLRDTRKLFGGGISLSPNFRYSERLDEENADGERWQRQGSWSAGAALSSTLYGTTTRTPGPLEAVRHVFSPNVGYSISKTGSNDANRSLSVRVSNSFQGKLAPAEGEEEAGKIDLLNLTSSSSYNFDADDRPWASISSSLEVLPRSAYGLTFSMAHDPYDWTLTRLSTGTSLRLRGNVAGALPARGDFGLYGDDAWGPRDGLIGGEDRPAPGQAWNMNVNYSYSYTRGSDSQSTVNGSFSFSPTKNWSLSYRANANLREGEILSHSYSLVRDLHCWRASFERQFTGTGASYYFRINVIDIPEIKYEQRSR